MKGVSILLWLVLFPVLIVGQEGEVYFIKAPKGLIIREQPNLSSKRIGKLPYGSTVVLLEETLSEQQITDNGNIINGVWVKVKYENHPFIVSESGNEEVGFVFNGYIEKLSKATIETKEMDSVRFFSLYKKPIVSTPLKISSQEEAEKLLSSKVKWKNIDDLRRVIDEIILDTGQRLRIHQASNDYDFVAYYPVEEIVLFEGGHSSEFSISIKTGESLETTGNPEYIVESPGKKLRLNGWFPGQECSSYFFQEKSGDNYTYLADFGWGIDRAGEDVCYFSKFCWLNDNEFIYSYVDHSLGLGQEKYFKGHINN